MGNQIVVYLTEYVHTLEGLEENLLDQALVDNNKQAAQEAVEVVMKIADIQRTVGLLQIH